MERNNNRRELKKTVLEITDSLCNRKGFDDWWYDLDRDIQVEIEKDIQYIIEKRLGENKNTNK